MKDRWVDDWEHIDWQKKRRAPSRGGGALLAPFEQRRVTCFPFEVESVWGNGRMEGCRIERRVCSHGSLRCDRRRWRVTNRALWERRGRHTASPDSSSSHRLWDVSHDMITVTHWEQKKRKFTFKIPEWSEFLIPYLQDLSNGNLTCMGVNCQIKVLRNCKWRWCFMDYY